ncbi:MAG: chaperonin GroEL, partial [Patescibacteria group bacterium]
PMLLKSQIEEALKVILDELKKLAEEVKDPKEIEQVATISSTDPVLGKLIAEAFNKVGKDGVITVDAGKTFETTVEYKQGMEIDRGYLSPYFVTNQDTVEAVIEEPYILITDKRINWSHEIVPFLETLVKNNIKNVVIFAGEVVEEAMATLVVNRLRGAFNICAIQAPAYGDRRKDELEDIAVLTGGQIILDESGRDLKSVQIEELGRADKVVADRDKSVIINGWGKKGAIDKRVAELKAQLKVANTDFDRMIKEERMAKLAGGVAVINVGAITEVELKDKIERVIDAKNATKAAVEEGIVAGGEIALLHVANSLLAWGKPQEPSLGGKILLEALKSPFKRIIENSGLDYAEIREKMSGHSYPEGVDVTDGQIKNLIEAGIIDPVKVTRSALENAVSVAIMVCTTSTLITDYKEKND